MPTATDFRSQIWDPSRVDASGKYMGRQVYWKLYSIENLARVLIHSILSAQVGANWWDLCVDPGIRNSIMHFQADYQGKPWHGSPGRHQLYYAHLTHLGKIMLTNSHLLQPLVPDIDQWIVRVEQVRLPRNIAAHMNWLDSNDRKRIDVFHADIKALLAQVAANGLQLLVP